jgi:hypothetical protein
MHISAESAGDGIPAVMAVGLRGLGPPAVTLVGSSRHLLRWAVAGGVWADAFRGEGINIAGPLQT